MRNLTGLLAETIRRRRARGHRMEFQAAARLWRETRRADDPRYFVARQMPLLIEAAEAAGPGRACRVR